MNGTEIRIGRVNVVFIKALMLLSKLCGLSIRVFLKSVIESSLDKESNFLVKNHSFAGVGLSHTSVNKKTYHMTRTAPRAISLENHKRKGPV